MLDLRLALGWIWIKGKRARGRRFSLQQFMMFAWNWLFWRLPIFYALEIRAAFQILRKTVLLRAFKLCGRGLRWPFRPTLFCWLFNYNLSLSFFRSSWFPKLNWNLLFRWLFSDWIFNIVIVNLFSIRLPFLFSFRSFFGFWLPFSIHFFLLLFVR